LYIIVILSEAKYLDDSSMRERNFVQHDMVFLRFDGCNETLLTEY